MNEFLNNAKERYNSPTPKFWKTMQPLMGFTFGGISAVQAMLPDGTPMWIKGLIVFVAGGLGYFVGKLGTTNNNLTNK